MKLSKCLTQTDPAQIIVSDEKKSLPPGKHDVLLYRLKMNYGYCHNTRQSCLTWSGIAIGRLPQLPLLPPMFLYNLEIFNTMSTILYDVVLLSTVGCPLHLW